MEQNFTVLAYSRYVGKHKKMQAYREDYFYNNKNFSKCLSIARTCTIFKGASFNQR
jgi:hypothetical protein